MIVDIPKSVQNQNSTALTAFNTHNWQKFGQSYAADAIVVLSDGQKLEGAGAVRDGGSFIDRMGAVACWNSVMDENQYMVRKWNEFIAS